MKILVSGASGLVGTSLKSSWEKGGHQILQLVRKFGGDGVFWDPDAGVLNDEDLVGCDAVVHLGGEPVAAGRWNKARKSRILLSRTKSTRLLAETLARLDSPPHTFVTASAVGWYGDRGDEALTEGARPGQGFLADVCQQWEAAAEAARSQRIRHVALRIGMVLSPRGGALARMLLPFRLGLGGVLGSGDQWVSWITLEDLVGVINHVLEQKDISGPVNAVAPGPVTMRDFTKSLGRAVKRPTWFPIPSFVARAAFGEMADELLLASTRVDSRYLVQSGFSFTHPQIDDALTALLHQT